MVIKILKISLIILVIAGIASCKHKKDDEMPKYIDSLVSLDAYSNRDKNKGNYLPLEIFSENGKLFARYIKNGKPLEKIQLQYSHTEKWILKQSIISTNG